MNKIYKLVWSKTKNMYVAVCEFARSHSKAPKSGVVKTSRIAFTTLAMFGTLLNPWIVNSVKAEGRLEYLHQLAGYYSDINRTFLGGNWLFESFTVQSNAKQFLIAKNLDNNTYRYFQVGWVDTGTEDGATNGWVEKTEAEAIQAFGSATKLNTAKAGIGGSSSDAITGLSASGKTITYTKADGTKGTITTQDTDTKYTAGNGLALSGTTFSAKAGTNVTVNANGISVTGNGSVASGNTGLIDGGKLYSEVRPSGNGNYVKTGNTTAANLTALDTQAKANANAIAAEVTNRTTAVNNEKTARENADTALSNRIGTVSADGSYIKKSATNDVSKNLTALDTQAKKNADAIAAEVTNRTTAVNNEKTAREAADTALSNRIGTVADGHYIKASNNVAQNLKALDDKVGENDVINGSNFLRTSNTVNLNLKALDTQAKNTADSVDSLDEAKAEKDASNVAAYAQQWADAIGTGTVTADDTKLVTGKTVYDALHNPNNTIEVKEVKTKELITDKATIKELESDKATIKELHTDTLEVNKEATFHDNATFEKDIEVKGTTTTKTLHVTENATVDGDLTVNGKSTFKDDVTMEKSLRVDGDGSFGGDLTVEGDTKLEGDLTVDGKSTFNDDVTMKKNLDVDGKATVGSLEVEGNGKVNGNWTVLGNQSVEGNSHIYGNQTVDGKSTVGSQEVLGDSIINGNQTIKKDLTVEGKSHLKGDVTMDNNAEIGKNLTVKGDSDLQGNAHVGKDLTVDGNADIGKDLHVTGESKLDGKVTMGSDASVAGNFSVAGKTELKDTLVDGVLEVNKEATFHDNVAMDKDLAVAGNASIGKDLTVEGTSTLKGDVTAESNMTVKGDSDLQGNADIGKDLHVKGQSQLDGNTTIGTEDSPADLLVNGNATVKGDTSMEGNANIGKDLTVEGVSNLKGNTTIGTEDAPADLLVNGNATVTGDSDLQGNANIGKDLTVEGTSTLKGDVFMNSNADIGKDLHVAGVTQLDGNTTIGTDDKPADLTVTGNSDLKGDVNIGGDLHADNGTSYFDKSIWHEGEEHQVEINETGIRVGLNSTHIDAHGVYAGGHNWDEAKAAMHEDGRIKGIYGYIEKDLEVGGNADVKGNLDVDGDTNIGGNTTIQQNLTVNGDSNFAGDVTMQKNLTVEGDSTVKGNHTVEQNLTVNGDSNFAGDVTMNKNLSVAGDTNIAGNTTIHRDLTVDGNSNVHGSSRVDKDFSVGGNSSFDGNVTMHKDLKVDGNANVGGTLVADKIIAGGKDMNNEIKRLDDRVDTVGAQAAALAGLHPIEYDPSQKWNIAASMGNYKGETAAAIGLFYRPSDRVMMNVGGTVGNSDNMLNFGISYALSKGTGASKSALQQQVKAQNAKIANMERAMQDMANKLSSLSLITDRKASFPDVPNGHWAKNAVDTLHGNNMVQGYPDGTFKGDKPMTRYEYAEMLFNALSKGGNVKKEHVQQYAPELRQIARKAGRPEVLKGYNIVVADNDANMQAAGQAYNARH